MTFKQTLMALTLTATTLQATAQADLMTPERLWQLGRIGSVAIAPDNSNSVFFALTHYDKQKNKGETTIWRTSASNASTPQKVTQGTAPAFINATTYAFMRGGDLYVARIGAEAEAKKVATDVDDFLFAPDGKHVILIRQVPSTSSIAAKEADLPLASGMIINDLMYKHWDHYVTTVPHPFVGIFDGTTITQLTDMLQGEPYECPMEPFGGVEQLAWSPDSRLIAYTCRKKTGRDYAISTDSDIFLYDFSTHKTIRNLCKPAGYQAPEVSPTESLEHQAVNQQDGDYNVGYDLNPQFSPDGRYVAWLSMERDGYESDRQRLCVLNINTGEKRYVTEAFQSGVDEFLWLADNYHLCFTGVWHGKTNVYTTSLVGEVRQLTNEQADFNLCGITPDGKSLILKRHSMQLPDDIYQLSLSSIELKKPDRVLPPVASSISQLTEPTQPVSAITAVNKDLLTATALGDVRERWVTTTDGMQMLCWVIYPPHFDPTKQYPALLFCEGGPQSPVSQFWSYRWNFQIMAANGYIIIAPNRRGLPGFGMKWLEQISGDYSGQCMQDYLSAIDDLCREPYVDKSRLGAVGASFGGYSVYWLAGNHNHRFKAFIAHDGIYNTQQQYVETEEMWFPNWDLGSAPWQRNAQKQMQKAYAQSPHLYVDKWDTPILCIHGQRDFRIEYTQAESAFTAARMRGIDAQLLLFPDENHWVLKPQNGILWQRTFFRWLDKYLK